MDKNGNLEAKNLAQNDINANLLNDIIGLKNENNILKDDIVDLKNENTNLNALIANQSLTKDYFYINDHMITLTGGSLYCFPEWQVYEDSIIDF